MEVGAFYRRKSDGMVLGQFINAEKTYINSTNPQFYTVAYNFTGKNRPHKEFYEDFDFPVNINLDNPPMPHDIEKVNREDVFIEPLYGPVNNTNTTKDPTTKNPFTKGRRGAHGGRKTRRRSPRRKTQKRRR